MLALSLSSDCHMGSRTCRLTHECTMCTQHKRIMLAAFDGMRLREANCWSFWNVFLSLLWGTSI